MGRSKVGCCVKVAGSPAAGIILYRAMVWKPTRDFGGRKWFAKSYAEMAEETGLSMKQVETALAKLRRDGLVQTSQHLFQGKNVMHMLVTSKAKMGVDQAYAEGAGVPPVGSAQVPPNGGTQEPPNGGASYTSYKQGDTQGEIQGDSETGLAGNSEEVLKMAGKVERPKTVAELLMAAEKKTLPKHAKKAGSVSALEMKWKDTVSEVYSCFVPQLTQKQLGQLKHFRDKCPAGRAEAVLEWAIRHWIEFVKAVETKVGLKTTPAEPRLDFLLLHAGIAINMGTVPKKPATVKQEAPVAQVPSKKVQLISQTQPKADAPETKEDLMAILGKGGD